MEFFKSPVQNTHHSRPDVALGSRPAVATPLSWVGMEKVATPIQLRLPSGESVITPAEVDLGVSLDQPEARGIHMSRLFRLAQTTLFESSLSFHQLRSLAEKMIVSQQGISQQAFLFVRTQLPLLRQALKSDEAGWRQYPIWIKVEGRSGQWHSRLGVEVLYSSTCPCSAALAKQVVLDQFDQSFSSARAPGLDEMRTWLEAHALSASPHAQRSRAVVEVALHADAALTPWELIDTIEEVLGTAVQAAVKRVDEQEFARLNAENLMFCEDAARLIKGALAEDDRFKDFEILVEHQESLHAHNAVARARK